MSLGSWVDQRIANALQTLAESGHAEAFAGLVANRVAERLAARLGRIDDALAGLRPLRGPTLQPGDHASPDAPWGPGGPGVPPPARYREPEQDPERC